MHNKSSIHIQLPADYKLSEHKPSPARKKGIVYYRVRDEYMSFYGERYFKVDYDNYKVINVCINGGEIKKGRPYMYGAYNISYSSFTSNYFWDKGKYMQEITVEIFEEKYKEVIQKMHICQSCL